MRDSTATYTHNYRRPFDHHCPKSIFLHWARRYHHGSQYHRPAATGAGKPPARRLKKRMQKMISFMMLQPYPTELETLEAKWASSTTQSATQQTSQSFIQSTSHSAHYSYRSNISMRRSHNYPSTGRCGESRGEYCGEEKRMI